MYPPRWWQTFYMIRGWSVAPRHSKRLKVWLLAPNGQKVWNHAKMSFRNMIFDFWRHIYSQFWILNRSRWVPELKTQIFEPKWTKTAAATTRTWTWTFTSLCFCSFSLLLASRTYLDRSGIDNLPGFLWSQFQKLHGIQAIWDFVNSLVNLFGHFGVYNLLLAVMYDRRVFD